MSPINSCPEAFSNDSCATWTENHDTALKAVRAWSIIMSTILGMYYISHCVILARRREKGGVSQEQLLKRRITYCLAVGYINLAAFYTLGNNLDYPIESKLGIVCTIAVVLAVLLIFTSCVLYLVIVQQLYLASCGSKVLKLAANSYNAVQLIIAPLVLFYCVLFILLFLGVVLSGIDITRVLYSASIPSIIIFGVQSIRYGRPVVAALENAASMEGGGGHQDDGSAAKSDGDVSKKLRQKAKVLKINMYWSVGGSILNSVLYCAVGFTHIMYNPTIFIVLQTQTMSPLVLAGLFIAPLFGASQLMCIKQAPVHPTTKTKSNSRKNSVKSAAGSSVGTLTSGL